MLYSLHHLHLVQEYKRTYKIISDNYCYRLPSSAKAIAEHQRALLDLRLFLDSIGIEMPLLKGRKRANA